MYPNVIERNAVNINFKYFLLEIHFLTQNPFFKLKIHILKDKISKKKVKNFTFKF